MLFKITLQDHLKGWSHYLFTKYNGLGTDWINRYEYYDLVSQLFAAGIHSHNHYDVEKLVNTDIDQPQPKVYDSKGLTININGATVTLPQPVYYADATTATNVTYTWQPTTTTNCFTFKK